MTSEDYERFRYELDDLIVRVKCLWKCPPIEFSVKLEESEVDRIEDFILKIEEKRQKKITEIIKKYIRKRN